MAQLPTRTTANTAAEHAADHNDTIRPVHNKLEAAVLAAASGQTLQMGSGGTFAAGLPLGLQSPSAYTAVAGVVLNDGEATTGWANDAGTGGYPQLDTTNKTTGASSVVTRGQIGAGTYRHYVDLASAVAVGSYQYVLVDMQWAQVDGATLEAGDVWRLYIGSAVGLGGTTSVAPIGLGWSENVWRTFAIPVGALASVRSIGIKSDAGRTEGLGATMLFRWDNVRYGNLTEFDQALGAASTAGVVVAPSYSPGATQESPAVPAAGKAVVDLREGRQHISRLNGHRTLREFGVTEEDGLTECSAKLAVALNDLAAGETITFSPKATYWVDNEIAVQNKRGVTVDLNGATLFTRVRQGGDNNNPKHMVELVGCENTTIRNGRIFGFREKVSNGSTLTTVAGTPTVSATTMLLDASGEAVRIPNDANGRVSFYARYPLVQFPSAVRALIAAAAPSFHVGNAHIFRLSDSAQVASDCTISLIDDSTGAVLASRTLTLTAAPTDYVLALEPADLLKRHRVQVAKATATANTITVTSVTTYGHNEYDGNYDANCGVQITDCRHVRVLDMWIEGVPTDGVEATHENNNGIDVARCTTRACGRMNYSANRGRNLSFRDVVAIAAGRSAIDIEPYAVDWTVENARVENLRAYYPENAIFALANWSRIVNLQIVGVESRGGQQVGFLTGGARGGLIANVHHAESGPSTTINLQGVGVRCENITVDTGIVFGSTTSDHTAGGVNTVYAPSGNTIEGCTITGPGHNIVSRAARCSWRNVTTAPAAPLTNSVAFTGTEHADDGAGSAVFGVDTGLNVQAPRTYRGTMLSKPLWMPRGFDLADDPLINVGGIAGGGSAITLHAQQDRTANGVGTGVDLGIRGSSGRFRLFVAATPSGTNPTLAVTVEHSVNNTNWRVAGAFRTRAGAGDTGPEFVWLHNLDRYVRASYTIGGTTPQWAFTVDGEYQHLPNNLRQLAVALGSGVTSKAVTFPSVAGPTFEATAVSGTTTGTLTPSTAYFYRLGARTKRRGPSTWQAEKTATLTAGQNAMNISIDRWLQEAGYYTAGGKGFWTEGFTLLRGTATGVYNTRFDVLPDGDFFRVRHDFCVWVDAGGSLVVPSGFIGFPTVYSQAGSWSAVDESGYEPDGNYAISVIDSTFNPGAGGFWITNKTRSGFTVNWTTATADANQKLAWVLLR